MTCQVILRRYGTLNYSRECPSVIVKPIDGRASPSVSAHKRLALTWLNHSSHRCTTPSNSKTTRMTAITSRMWMALPTFGILGLSDPPKKPSSHKIRSIYSMG
jgi:hypothetical protein